LVPEVITGITVVDHGDPDPYRFGTFCRLQGWRNMVEFCTYGKYVDAGITTEKNQADADITDIEKKAGPTYSSYVQLPVMTDLIIY
jgi:hypothetical protein